VRHHKVLMMNALDPEQMTAAERLTEVADLLAAALIRRQERKSSPLSPDCGENSLDCSAPQSGHANALKTHGGSD
jgi:hypothetical protein